MGLAIFMFCFGVALAYLTLKAVNWLPALAFLSLGVAAASGQCFNLDIKNTSSGSVGWSAQITSDTNCSSGYSAWTSGTAGAGQACSFVGTLAGSFIGCLRVQVSGSTIFSQPLLAATPCQTFCVDVGSGGGGTPLYTWSGCLTNQTQVPVTYQPYVGFGGVSAPGSFTLPPGGIKCFLITNGSPFCMGFDWTGFNQDGTVWSTGFGQCLNAGTNTTGGGGIGDPTGPGGPGRTPPGDGNGSNTNLTGGQFDAGLTNLMNELGAGFNLLNSDLLQMDNDVKSGNGTLANDINLGFSLVDAAITNGNYTLSAINSDLSVVTNQLNVNNNDLGTLTNEVAQGNNALATNLWTAQAATNLLSQANSGISNLNNTMSTVSSNLGSSSGVLGQVLGTLRGGLNVTNSWEYGIWTNTLGTNMSAAVSNAWGAGVVAAGVLSNSWGTNLGQGLTMIGGWTTNGLTIGDEEDSVWSVPLWGDTRSFPLPGGGLSPSEVENYLPITHGVLGDTGELNLSPRAGITGGMFWSIAPWLRILTIVLAAYWAISSMHEILAQRFVDFYGVPGAAPKGLESVPFWAWTTLWLLTLSLAFPVLLAGGIAAVNSLAAGDLPLSNPLGVGLITTTVGSTWSVHIVEAVSMVNDFVPIGFIFSLVIYYFAFLLALDALMAFSMYLLKLISP